MKLLCYLWLLHYKMADQDERIYITTMFLLGHLMCKSNVMNSHFCFKKDITIDLTLTSGENDHCPEETIFNHTFWKKISKSMFSWRVQEHWLQGHGLHRLGLRSIHPYQGNKLFIIPYDVLYLHFKINSSYRSAESQMTNCYTNGDGHCINSEWCYLYTKVRWWVADKDKP